VTRALDPDSIPESAAPSNPRVSELLRRTESLELQLRAAEGERDALAARLTTLTLGGAADRELRRAALNLMEDAVAARSAERRENEERRRIEDELRQADRRKDEFLAMLAHELRGPLAPVRNSLNVLKVDGTDAATTARLLAMMDRQVSHMVRLVDDLLDVSRITRGRVELRREMVTVADVVYRAVEASEALIEELRHALDLTLPDETLVLDCDPVRIAQVLTNLLNNAAKYTSPRGRISLVAAREGSDVEIRVRDTGAGIPSQMLPEVFDLFTQIDRTYDRARGGLGIGLTLARSLVEMHQGRIQAESAGVDQGSTFTVTLPLARESAVPAARPARRDLSTARVSRRIVVVDDDVDTAETLSMLLELLGDQVTIANEGLAALATVERVKPSVVLLDIGMPRMDGYEVARRLRQLPGGAQLSLIALTGWGQRDDRERSRAAGFDHHLVKPVALDTLEGLLATLPSNNRP
jgi:signal transduction histidine kinase/ActR/RegA family two-component response regulator